MSVFADYANVYDAIYLSKDYDAECDFIEQVFTRFADDEIRTILDLGCGTGGHAIPLAARGYQVTGLDRSSGMIQQAVAKAGNKFPEGRLTGNYEFVVGDIREFELGKFFDVAIAMFAVLGYQITNQDLVSAFNVIRKHLNPGGLLFFDCWFGPAVLSQKPEQRYKIVEWDGARIIRLAQPALDLISQVVDVNYDIFVIEKGSVVKEIRELHRMRYFFAQELELILSQTGFEILRVCPFGNLDEKLGFQDWNMAVVARAK